MRDKHGNEIKVGDSIKTSSDIYATVCHVTYSFMAATAKNGITLKYSCIDKPDFEIIKAQETKSLSELKRKAQQEIQSVIQKHTALINSAGGNLDINVSFYDAKILGNGEPKQLVEVSASVTI